MSITKVTLIGLFLVVAGVIAPTAANAQTPGVREVTSHSGRSASTFSKGVDHE